MLTVYILCASYYFPFATMQEASDLYVNNSEAMHRAECDEPKAFDQKLSTAAIVGKRRYVMSVGYMTELLDEEAAEDAQPYEKPEDEPFKKAPVVNKPSKCYYWFVRTGPHELRMMKRCL